MNATATRLGSSPLTIDWSGFTRVPAQASPSTPPIHQAWSMLKARFDSKEIGFYDAPIRNE